MEIDDQSKYVEIILDKEVLINNPNPTSIAYAPNYLAVLNNHIQQMPVAVFEAMIRKQPGRSHFCWSENLIVEKSLINTKVTVSERYIDESFSSTIDGLVVFNMGAQLGHGVATLKPIKQGTIITHYAGYILGFNTNRLMIQDIMSSYRMEYSNNCVIDAREIANIASFIQDGPNKDELVENYLIEPAIAAKVAVANVMTTTAIFREKKIVAIKAVRDIEAGEIIVFNYGNDYWNKLFLICNKSRLLFTAQGEVIPVELYQHKDIRLRVKYDVNHYVTLPYSALIKAVEHQQSLRYSFIPNNGRETVKELTLNEVMLILDKSLWTTVVDDNKLFLKNYIMQRLQKEYQLRNLLYPLKTIYHKYFLKEGEKLRKVGDNIKQVIAHLLQALLLGLKENATINDLAAIYLALAMAYADKAKQADEIPCMEIAIYLLKRSIKLAPIQKSILSLQECYDWWLHNIMPMNNKKTLRLSIYTKIIYYWHRLIFKCFCLFYNNRNR